MSKATFQCLCGNSATPTLLYKGDFIQTFQVEHFILSNSDNGNANVSVYLVPPGASPAIANAVIHLVKITGNSYIEGAGGFIIPPQYSVYVQSTTNNDVVATMSGTLSASNA
jgi:hypothetical protein